MKEKLLLLVFATLLSNCAYLNSGATQRITILPENPRDSVFVNEKYLGNGSTSVLLLKKNDYLLTLKSPDSTAPIREPVAKRFDMNTLWDWPLIAYLPVDLTTGSHHYFADGAHSRTTENRIESGPLLDLKNQEAAQRSRLIKGGWYTLLFMALGSGFAQMATDPVYHGVAGKSLQTAMFAGTVACAGGLVYNVYRQFSAVHSINGLLKDEEYK